MPELSEEDRGKAKALLAELRAKIDEVAAGDEALRFQMKRYMGSGWSSMSAGRRRIGED